MAQESRVKPFLAIVASALIAIGGASLAVAVGLVLGLVLVVVGLILAIIAGIDLRRHSRPTSETPVPAPPAPAPEEPRVMSDSMPATKPPRFFGRNLWTLTSTFAAGMLVIGIPWSITALLHGRASQPSVQISSVTWPAGQKGLFTVQGYDENLGVDEMLWVFNQVMENNQGGTVYANPGPCANDSPNHFNCTLGFGGSPDQKGLEFNIIVVVVTGPQAYQDARAAERLSSETWPSVDSIPHVPGSETLSQLNSIREN